MFGSETFGEDYFGADVLISSSVASGGADTGSISTLAAVGETINLQYGGGVHCG